MSFALLSSEVYSHFSLPYSLFVIVTGHVTLFFPGRRKTQTTFLYTKAPSLSVPKVVLSFMLVLPLAFSACEGFDSCCLFITFADCFFRTGSVFLTLLARACTDY